MSKKPKPITIPEIITRAGGAVAIAAKTSEVSPRPVSADAVYKWKNIGIPDYHWPIIMPMAKVTADQMLQANIIAREAQAA